MTQVGTLQYLFNIGLTRKPWTDIADYEFTDSIRKKKLVQLTTRNDKKATVLLLGPTHVGKSSCVNSFASLATGRAANLAYTAAGNNVTNQFNVYHTGLDKLKICDMPGIMKKKHIRTDDVAKVLEGHVQHGYQFTTDSSITENSTYYRKDPQYEDKIKCVAFVYEAALLKAPMDLEISKQICKLQDVVKEKGIPRVLILTKIDQLCPWIDYDIKYASRSELLKTSVEQASKQFDIPEMYIYPVTNYYKLETIKVEKNKLIWFAWESLFNSAYDYMEQTDSRLKSLK